MTTLAPGDLIWIAPDPAIGREQGGRRPALVVASDGYLATVDALAIVVPITSVDRGWPNHVPISGTDLSAASWAMTEQVRTISRERVVGHAGAADAQTLVEIRRWISDFLDL